MGSSSLSPRVSRILRQAEATGGAFNVAGLADFHVHQRQAAAVLEVK